MPDQQQGYKQTHGGDDTGGSAEPLPAKKPSLTKFASAPDVNIRDVFWRIMAEYAAKKGKDVDAQKYTPLRSSLIRIALSVLENPDSAYHGLSPGFTALYTLTLILDGRWEDMFRTVLEETASSPKTRAPVVRALRRLLQTEPHRATLTTYFEHVVKDLAYVSSALVYLVEVGDAPLVEALKKWIVVIAQTDIESNQIYAISALALLPPSEDIKALLLRLLAHWDPQTRKAVATLLQRRKDDNVRAHARRQLQTESDPAVKKFLEKLAS